MLGVTSTPGFWDKLTDFQEELGQNGKFTKKLGQNTKKIFRKFEKMRIFEMKLEPMNFFLKNSGENLPNFDILWENGG